MTSPIWKPDMVSEGYDIATVVRSNDPRNSLYIQAQLLNAALERLYGVRTKLAAGSSNVYSSLRQAVQDGWPVLFHYGSFEPWLILLRGIPQAHLIYHNHTPLRYCWYWGEKVALLDVLTNLQLRLLNRSISWIAVSPFNVRCLRQLGYRNVTYCPCLISTGSEGRRSVVKTREPTLLYVGHISPSKNSLVLLRQARTVAARMRRPVNLRIIGDVKPGSLYGYRFEKAVRGMESDPYLQVDWMRKYVSPDRLSDLYSSSWLYVSCSQHEGFGLPACEAIMNGTPALYSECGGQESVLNDLGSVSASDPLHFSNAAIELLVRPENRDTLLRAQKEAVAQFTAPGNHAAIRSVFDPVLAFRTVSAR